jgi:hypothetical protein
LRKRRCEGANLNKNFLYARDDCTEKSTAKEHTPKEVHLQLLAYHHRIRQHTKAGRIAIILYYPNFTTATCPTIAAIGYRVETAAAAATATARGAASTSITCFDCCAIGSSTTTSGARCSAFAVGAVRAV